MVKMLSVLPELIDNAVGVEMHGDRYVNTYKETPNLQNMYVLISTYRDGDRAVPVRFEIKEFNNQENKLYVTVTVNEKETGFVAGVLTDNQLLRTAPPVSKISITELLKIVNESVDDLLNISLTVNFHQK